MIDLNGEEEEEVEENMSSIRNYRSAPNDKDKLELTYGGKKGIYIIKIFNI